MTRGSQGQTLGDMMTRANSSQYTAESSSNPLRIIIRKSRPAKPVVTPTTSTPFELIQLSTRVKKCAGCRRGIKDGPDKFTSGDIDMKYCIRHKEHDFVWVESHKQFKRTFENKHYHVYSNCVRGRNPQFDPSALPTLRERLY